MNYKKVINSSPVKWMIFYTIFITVASLLASSLISDDKETIITSKEEAKTEPVKPNKTDKSNEVVFIEKDEVKKKKNEIINNLMEKYNALDFSELDYSFTYDYQKNLNKKNVLFYLFIEDIFEEKKNTFIKSQKVTSNQNILLKMRCSKMPVDSIMNYKYFIYMVAKINDVSKILFNTKAELVKNGGERDEAFISFDTNNEGLLIQGDCLEIVSE